MEAERHPPPAWWRGKRPGPEPGDESLGSISRGEAGLQGVGLGPALGGLRFTASEGCPALDMGTVSSVKLPKLLLCQVIVEKVG